MQGLDSKNHNDGPILGVGLRRVLYVVASVLLLSLLVAWFVYRMLWGFGGFYTHVRYIPTPEHIIRDEATSLLDIDAERGQRRYWAELTVDELIAFNQQALPEMGWRIIAEGESPPTDQHYYYCIIVEQRGVRAYVYMAQGATPEIAVARISINHPNSLCAHLLE